MRLSPQQKAALEAMEPRMRVVLLMSAVLFMAIVFRLWSLQFAERERYLALAQRNYLRTVTESALRGRIFDRNGKPLAENVPVYDLVGNWVGIPSRSRNASIRRLAPLGGKTEKEIWSRLRAVQANHEGDQAIEQEVGFAKVVAVREARIPGVEVRVRPMRNYPYGRAACHLSGYLGEISGKELERHAARYRMGEWVGKRAWNASTNSIGRFSRERTGSGRFKFSPPADERGDSRRVSAFFAGRDIWTTLDIDLQLAAEEILGASEGAIVAMDPEPGTFWPWSAIPPSIPMLLCVPAGLRNGPKRSRISATSLSMAAMRSVPSSRSWLRPRVWRKELSVPKIRFAAKAAFASVRDGNIVISGGNIITGMETSIWWPA
jgi:penicillin-binding protein 2